MTTDDFYDDDEAYVVGKPAYYHRIMDEYWRRKADQLGDERVYTERTCHLPEKKLALPPLPVTLNHG